MNRDATSEIAAKVGAGETARIATVIVGTGIKPRDDLHAVGQSGHHHEGWRLGGDGSQGEPRQ